MNLNGRDQRHYAQIVCYVMLIIINLNNGTFIVATERKCYCCCDMSAIAIFTSKQQKIRMYSREWLHCTKHFAGSLLVAIDWKYRRWLLPLATEFYFTFTLLIQNAVHHICAIKRIYDITSIWYRPLMWDSLNAMIRFSFETDMCLGFK